MYPVIIVMFYIARVFKKKRQALPKPSDSRSGALSVGPSVINDSWFGALSQWWHIFGINHWPQLKKKLKCFS